MNSENDKKPWISVVTPSYNCASYLRDCIEGVRSQNCGPFEHIIADGASTDGTVDILKQYPHLRWISEPDKGESEALNKALRMATGEVILWLNADDLVMPGAFRQAMNALDPVAGRHVVYGQNLLINETGSPTGLRIPIFPVTLSRLMRWFDHLQIYQPTMYFTRQVIEDVGLFDQELFFSIDLEYWMRVAAKGYSFTYLDSPLAKMRLDRQGAKSSNPRVDQEKNWLSVTQRYLPHLTSAERRRFWHDYYVYCARNPAAYPDGGPVPPDADAVVGLCMASSDSWTWTRLGTLVESVLDRYGALPELNAYLGECLLGCGAPDKAQIFFQRFLELSKEVTTAQTGISGFEAAEMALAEIRPWETRTAEIVQDKPAAEAPSRGSLAPCGSHSTSGIHVHARPPKALVFMHFSPYPSQTGSHVFTVMGLQMLKRAGYDLVVASSPMGTDEPWSANRISQLARDFGALVELHKESQVGSIWLRIQLLKEQGFSTKPWVTPSLALWFEKLVKEHRPELILINYAKWGPLAEIGRSIGTISVLQTHDILSVNRRLSGILEPHFGALPMDLNAMDESLLRHDLFDGIDQSEIPGLNEEIAVMKDFDLNIFVSQQEMERIQRMAPKVPVHYLPMVFPPRSIKNTRKGPPLFLAAFNPFNLQGGAFFLKKVLPLIRKEDPKFFIRIAGTLCKAIKPAEGLDLLGYVDDLEALYAETPYSICPLLGGTGQQVKVMEAMSYGVPVIVLPRIAKATGVVDGVNGLVAADAPAFAEACLRIGRDPELARRLGENAREYMLAHHSIDAAYVSFEESLRKAKASRFEKART